MIHSEGFVRASLLSICIAPNASSLQIDLYLGANERYALGIGYFMVHGLVIILSIYVN